VRVAVLKLEVMGAERAARRVRVRAVVAMADERPDKCSQRGRDITEMARCSRQIDGRHRMARS